MMVNSLAAQPNADGTTTTGLDRRLELGKNLERQLGDVWSHPNFGITAAIQRSETDADPTDAFMALQKTGFLEWTVPQHAGGSAVDVDETFLLSRLVARRDQTLAVAALASTVGFMPIWVAAHPEQLKFYGDQVREGKRFGFALSESKHGSDIVQNDTTGQLEGDTWIVAGSKQAIGNAINAEWLTVVCRTKERPGPGSLSIIMVDRVQNEQSGSFTFDRKWMLQGLRGFGLGDFTLDGATADHSALIGKEGHGLEIMLRSSQVVRSFITAMGFGAADTSLRIAMDFCNAHKIFDKKLRDAPYTRYQMSSSFAELMYYDAANFAAIRGLQAIPDMASTVSSAIKYGIPKRISGILTTLTEVLGARHYDREHPRIAAHMKGFVDSRISHFADGNEVVNLRVLLPLAVESLPPDIALLDFFARENTPDLVYFADFSRELPEFRPETQEVFSRKNDTYLAVLSKAAHHLRGLAANTADNTELVELADAALVDLTYLWDSWRSEGAYIREHDANEKGRAPLAEVRGLKVAAMFSNLIINACALATWLGNPEFAGDEISSLRIIRAVLAHEAGNTLHVDEQTYSRLFDILDSYHHNHRLFSTIPVEVDYSEATMP